MKRWGLLCAGLIAAGWMSSAHAAYQTDVQFVGISKDLNKLGVSETWADPVDDIPHCKATLYQEGKWEPVSSESMTGEKGTENSTSFVNQCKLFLSKWGEQYELQSIKWDAALFNPAPPRIKDKNDDLIPGLEKLKTAYPLEQQYNVALRPDDNWQVFLKSEAKPGPFSVLNQNPVHYQLVLRPQLEPIPYYTTDATYEGQNVLYTPIKVLTSEYYAVIAVVFREISVGQNDLDYHYRVLYTKWPNYQAMDLEEAKDTLSKATEYAMEENELKEGPNTRHTSYRAYLRLKAAKLSVDDILNGIDESSAAGKLYWLDLLSDRDPIAYEKIKADVISDTSAAQTVIEVHGESWETVPFKAVLNTLP